MAGDTADHVEGDDKKQDIFQSAEPVVADHPEKMVKWFFVIRNPVSGLTAKK